MTGRKFTQEEWFWDHTIEGADILASDPEGAPILIAELNPDLNKEKLEANAQLIASAPELLRACENILNGIRSGWPGDRRIENICENVIKKARGL